MPNTTRFYVIDRAGHPYEGGRRGGTMFFGPGTEPTSQTRIYSTLERARRERDRIASLLQEPLFINRATRPRRRH